MASLPAGYTLEEFVAAELSDADQEALLDLFNRTAREREPRHEDYSKDEMLMVFGSPGEVRQRFLVRDDTGTSVALANAAYADDGSNPNRLRVAITVDPRHRRLGVGSVLLEAAVGVANETSRSRLTSFIFDTVAAGEEFVVAIGGYKTLDHHSNILPLVHLDRELMQQWVDEGPRRAPGYSVELIEGVYPDEILDQMAHLYFILERDMPTEEGLEPRNWDARQVAEFIGHFAEGGDMLTAIAFQDESGDAVGMSQLFRRSGAPKTWIVTTTMVDPEHRGRALGKWVKGAVNLAALERWPDGEYQETGNAKTNDAMLGINNAMGFEPELTVSEVAASVEAVEAYLATRG